MAFRTFARFKGNTEYYLVLRPGENLTTEEADVLKDRHLKTVFHSGKKAVEQIALDQTTGKITDRFADMRMQVEAAKTSFAANIGLGLSRGIDYGKFANKYGSIIIRENGTWQGYFPEQYDSIVYSEVWPKSWDKADIVICENDPEPEKEWVEWLQKEYPGRTISTINFFGTRNDADLQSKLKDCNLITFSTTFTNTDWWEALLRNKGDQPIVGYCHNYDSWPNVEGLNVTKIKNL